LEALKAGAAKGVKTITGSNLDEWKLFDVMVPSTQVVTEENLAIELSRTVSTQNVSKLIEVYRRALLQRGSPNQPEDILSAIHGDWLFRMPGIRFIEARRANHEEAYAYLFTWQSPALNGFLQACHSLDIGFVFGETDSTFCGSGPDVDKLSWEIQEAWIKFARAGNPGTNNLGIWPLYGEKRETMILGKISHVEDAPLEEERAIWDEIGGA